MLSSILSVTPYEALMEVRTNLYKQCLPVSSGGGAKRPPLYYWRHKVDRAKQKVRINLGLLSTTSKGNKRIYKANITAP